MATIQQLYDALYDSFVTVPGADLEVRGTDLWLRGGKVTNIKGETLPGHGGKLVAVGGETSGGKIRPFIAPTKLLQALRDARSERGSVRWPAVRAYDVLTTAGGDEAQISSLNDSLYSQLDQTDIMKEWRVAMGAPVKRSIFTGGVPTPVDPSDPHSWVASPSYGPIMRAPAPAPIPTTTPPPATFTTGPAADGRTSKKVRKPNIDCWTLAEAVAQVSTRLLLYGPPGTGKSYGAARMGVNPKGPDPVIVTCTEDMSAIQLIGHFIPKGGEMVWMDGPIIRAWRTGSRLVINEIDRASGDVLTFLLAALDDPATAALTLPNDRHETVRPMQGFTVVATMNGEPDTDLPAPLRDRFASCINIDRVHPRAIELLPPDLRHAAETSALVTDESRRISVRKWNEFAYLRETFTKLHGEVTGLQMAALAVFAERAQEALDAMSISKVGA